MVYYHSLHTSEEVENRGPVTTDIHSNSLLEAWQAAAMHDETGANRVKECSMPGIVGLVKLKCDVEP